MQPGHEIIALRVQHLWTAAIREYYCLSFLTSCRPLWQTAQLLQITQALFSHSTVQSVLKMMHWCKNTLINLPARLGWSSCDPRSRAILKTKANKQHHYVIKQEAELSLTNCTMLALAFCASFTISQSAVDMIIYRYRMTYRTLHYYAVLPRGSH